MQPRFVHLNLHTEYSIIDGMVRVKELIKNCVEHNMPAVAVTDFCNFFGLVKFYQSAMAAGIKPIIGVDMLMVDEIDGEKSIKLTLLCQNNQGYNNAKKLISKAYIDGQYLGVPRIKREWLGDLRDGLLVLLDDAEIEEAKNNIDFWRGNFGDRFYLKIKRINRTGEEQLIAEIVKFAEENKLPLVATNSVCFIKADDFEAHEARVCIHSGYVLDDKNRPREYTEQQYLRSASEMQRLFHDMPEALKNSSVIAQRCTVFLEFDQVYLPDYPVPNNTTIGEFLSHQSLQGLEDRSYPENKKSVYLDRLNYELDVINKMGFAGYFLIVADFIRWAKEHDIPVGPGRGSGAGSLVAFVLKITDLDPIEHDLLFERFLNPERVSMPDFDIDFCMEGRDRVIDYVAEHYGRRAVSQIITFGTMAAKAVVRDVGRVLGHPYGFVDMVAKLIPFELGITLDKALKEEERLKDLYNKEEEVKLLIDLAKKLEGVTRNAGKHAGGVVIAPSDLTDFAPLYCEPGGVNLVTQFDKNDVEAIGLVKFDFLGLRTLTIINWAIQAVKKKQSIDINNIPLDDAKTFNLLKNCQTLAVFQLESRGMRDLVKRLQPDSFSDIVALVALFRPGPLQSGMVDDFIERKHGRAAVYYPHPALEPILKDTYGVILYQEQVMQIAQVLAGYSLGAADLLRRAMGKKKPEEMAKQRAVFIEGANNNNIDKHLANSIFDLMEKFAGYGFNKSHSAGYALISYQTAWLKVHYPAEFMAAVLSSDMDNTDKVALYFEESNSLGLTILPPSINEGDYKFKVNAEGNICYGLGAIKGVGEAAIEELISARENSDLYDDLFDLCKRVDTRKVNKKVLEALIKSGALDKFNKERSVLFASIATALKLAEQHAKEEMYGQGDLFGDFEEDKNDNASLYVQADVWSDQIRLDAEKETLGLYLTGHPIAQYEAELMDASCIKISDLSLDKPSVMVAGFIAALKTITTKSGKKMAVVTLEDRSGRLEVTLFSEIFAFSRELLQKGRLVIVSGDLSFDNFTENHRLNAREIFDLEIFRGRFVKYLNLEFIDRDINNDLLQKLKEELQQFKKNDAVPIRLKYKHDGVVCELMLGDEWRIKPDDVLLLNLQNKLGIAGGFVY
ncbi:MAG: DNA polymerase III subunit alpha [Gammaproteobacteria bacterium]|nr:DNA polymerase III subunit alpha [Gammaproteobacteria bacterium]